MDDPEILAYAPATIAFLPKYARLYRNNIPEGIDFPFSTSPLDLSLPDISHFEFFISEV